MSSREEFISLYNELLEIRLDPVFHFYGFGTAGPYNNWLVRMKAWAENSADVAAEIGIGVNDLLVMGMSYVRWRGQETDFTQLIHKMVQKWREKL